MVEGILSDCDRVKFTPTPRATPKDTPMLGFFPTGNFTFPFGACSDGLNFWITLGSGGTLARF